MRGKRRTGFTLIEVLLVIFILGMLAAFVVPRFMSAGEEAKVGLVKAAIGPSGPVAFSLDHFRLHVGRYPTSEEGLKGLVERPDDIDEDKDLWKGPYIANAEQLKDPWQNDFEYKCPGDVNTDSYDLWSNGVDGQEGTDDDIKNWKSDQD